MGSQGSKTLTMWKIWKQLQFKILLCHLVDNNQSFKKVNGDLVIWPHLKGSKVKMCNLFTIFKMLLLLQIKCMVTWLLHIDQLDTLYKSYGSKNSSGVIWGHRSQKLIFTKNAVTPKDYMVWSCDSCICIS